ncbi:MAG: hypothetical protein IKS05_02320 [Oscillospiraceae bacterium]|nr:hypothetical protein [Oscillospiraceae bacterium]
MGNRLKNERVIERIRNTAPLDTSKPKGVVHRVKQESNTAALQGIAVLQLFIIGRERSKTESVFVGLFSIYVVIINLIEPNLILSSGRVEFVLHNGLGKKKAVNDTVAVYMDRQIEGRQIGVVAIQGVRGNDISVSLYML